MEQKALIDPDEPSRLQRDLLPRVIALIRSERLAPGARLTELWLARRLQVSRTPVRGVLELLARRGILVWQPRRGFALARPIEEHDEVDLPEPSDSVDELCLAIARDRVAGRLPEEVSEADIMRRYSVTRPFLLRVLSRLAELALVERKPGHGWLLSPVFYDPQARAESYVFRGLIEPAGLLQSGFRLPEGWLAGMRRRHEAMMAAPWRETESIALFEMNAAFHEGLAAASGNRYFLIAIQQQTRLRRFSNYDWTHGYERVVASCTEHLEIIDRLERDEREVAAALLRQHLEKASRLAPSI